MLKMSLKSDILKFSNSQTIVFICVLVICFVLFSFVQFSSNGNQFYYVSDRNIKKFSFYQFLRKNFNFTETLKPLFIPNNTVMTKNEVFEASEKDSNLPLIYYSNWQKFHKSQVSLKGNFTVCDTELPSPHLLKFNNFFWQQLIVEKDVKLFIYNAYYDNRENTKKVKVITVTNFQKATDQMNLW